MKSVSYLVQIHLLRKNRLQAVAPDVGLTFNIAAFDVVGRSIFKKGVYEPEITNWLLKHVRFQKGDVFIDVGANIGWYSILVDRHHPGCEKIVSFEPDRTNFELLRGNIEKNRCHKIDAKMLALSNEAGRKAFYRYSNRNLGRHSMLPINTGDEITVETAVLDEYWDRHVGEEYFPRLMKIDTEGYEFQVLQGARKLMARCPAIIAEFSPHFMKQAGLNPEELLDFLYAFGYLPQRFSADGPVPMERQDLQAIEKNENILWLKQPVKHQQGILRD